MVRTGRSSGFSSPPPRIRHGLRGMMRSSAAVMRTARSSRYDFAVVVCDTPALSSVACHSRTVSGVMLPSGVAPR